MKYKKYKNGTTFTIEFNKVVQKNKRKKKRKQEIYERNIEPYKVYMDEHGEIKKKSNAPMIMTMFIIILVLMILITR